MSDNHQAQQPEEQAEHQTINNENTTVDMPFMPKPTFSTFILSLASSTLVHLGDAPDPATGETKEDIVMAKHSIDLLTMLQEKIQNGLDAEEKRLIDGLLYELRMKYVVKK